MHMTSLTFSRQLHQSLVLFNEADEQVVITVQSIKPHQVSLNFEASKSVAIWRDDILEHDGDQYYVRERM